MSNRRDRSIPPRHSHDREETRNIKDLPDQAVPLYLQAPVPTPPSESFEIPEVPPTTTETTAIVDDVIQSPNQPNMVPPHQGDTTMEHNSLFVSDLARAVFILTNPDMQRKAENLGLDKSLIDNNPLYLIEWHAKINLVLSTGCENNPTVQLAKLQLASLYLDLCQPASAKSPSTTRELVFFGSGSGQDDSDNRSAYAYLI